MQEKKKNICIIVQHLHGGGAERVAADLSISLSETNNVYVIIFNKVEDSYKYGGTLLNVNLPPRKRICGKIINIIKRILAIRKIKKIYSIDCSISLLNNANLINILSRRKERVIVSVHSLMSVSITNKLERYIVKLIAKYADYTVVVSKAARKDLTENFNIDNSKVKTIYNSCNINNLVKNEQSFLLDDIKKNKYKYKYITTIGRLENPKGQWHLIKAFKKVHEKLPTARLIIVGEGRLREELLSLTDYLGLSEYVIFTGFISNPIEVLKISDIFVFSSIYEGFGNVILEAMATGKAVISTDCNAGPREIIAPNTLIDKKTNKIEYAKYGILVPSFNLDVEFNNNDNISNKEKIMGDAIYKLIIDSELREKYEKCSNIRIKDFSSENILKQWNEIID